MKVGIIDYGASNLYSIDRSLRYLGANTLIIDEPSKLKEVDKLIFPGQGSLGSAMSHLKKIGHFHNPLHKANPSSQLQAQNNSLSVST